MLQIVHRTMAAFIGSTCTLAVLSMIDKVCPIYREQTLYLPPLLHAIEANSGGGGGMD